MKPMASMFDWSSADISLSFTLIMSTAAATAIFAGKALEYIQPRLLLLIGGAIFGTGIACLGFIRSLAHLHMFSLLAGVGLGTVYPGATMSNIIRLFPDKRGMASGLLTAGYGLGALVWAPVSVNLIGHFGVMHALNILGIAFFLIIALMSCMVETTPEAGLSGKGRIPHAENPSEEITSKDRSWKGMMGTPDFYVLAVIFTAGTLSGMMVVGHASPIAQDILNFTPEGASAPVGLLAVGMVFGKVIWGVLSDRTGRYPVFIAIFMLAAAALFMMSKTTSYLPFITAMCTVGLCYGGFLSLMGPVTAEVFGQKHLGINFGIMFLTIAVAAYLGPMLAAVVKQANNGDYTKAFIIAGFINIAGIMLMACFMLYRRCKIPKDS